jgi:hypothetical protein
MAPALRLARKRMMEMSLVMALPIATDEGELDENYRTCRGDRRKDVFAQAFVPKFVHWQAKANEYKTPDIEAELN